MTSRFGMKQTRLRPDGADSFTFSLDTCGQKVDYFGLDRTK